MLNRISNVEKTLNSEKALHLTPLSALYKQILGNFGYEKPQNELRIVKKYSTKPLLWALSLSSRQGLFN